MSDHPEDIAENRPQEIIVACFGPAGEPFAVERTELSDAPKVVEPRKRHCVFDDSMWDES